MSKNKNISRRRFLKGVTGAVIGTVSLPYIIPASALGGNGSFAPSERIVMGCIGLGGNGTWDLKEFLGKSGVQIVAVCDVNTKARNSARDIVNEKYGNKDCATYGDFRELIARKDIDAVMNSTPDHWHSIIAITAIRAGKDIHSQKPLAHTIAEGRAICDAVKRYGAVFQTGSQQRSDREFRRACELVRNGRIGKVQTVRVGLLYGGSDVYSSPMPKPVPEGLDWDMWLGPSPAAPYTTDRLREWRWVSDYSSGQITDWAGHNCDIAQWGMGTEHTSPVEIEGSGVFPADGGLYDTAYSYRFECKYAEGFTMIVEDSEKHPKSKNGITFSIGWRPGLGVLFEGNEGWVHVDRGGMNVYPESLADTEIRPSEIHLYKSDDHKQNFLDCIRTRSQTIAPPEISHRSIMIGYLGAMAIKLGRKLRWDPVKEEFINDSEANRLLSQPMRSPWHL